VLSLGWAGDYPGSSSQLQVMLPCWRGPAGAPAAAQRRGRTSWTPTSGGWSSGAGKVPFVLVV